MLKLDRMEITVADIKAVCNGDSKAWAKIYNSLFDPVYKFVYFRVGRNQQDTEDIVQETFMAIVQSIRTFDETKGEFYPWCLGIARQKVAAYYRGKKTVALEENFSALVERMSNEILPDELIIKMEFVDFFGAAFSTIPLHYQEVLKLKYIDDVDFNELSNRLEVSLVAAKSLVMRAKEELRGVLKRNSVEPF